MLAAIAFYVFAAVLVASAAMVVTARNPVHSVLFLILAFFNAAGLFLIAGAEFLAMILVIVYVGAVAVLFLFVVMMLDVDFARLREGFQRYAPIGFAVGLVLFLELAFVLWAWTPAPEAGGLRMHPQPGAEAGLSNTEALARVLYTDNVLLFQAAGVILLIAMIGAIVLTLRERPGTRRQVIAAQLARVPGETVVLRQVPTGAGLKDLGILRPPLPPAEEPEALPEPEHHGHGGGHH
ncbi:MAG: NADH-quinone oxidoreductase subunit J [Acetobacteraceae bacterium]|nr:NADH-quinone oxidoreductase subunit J [Acetobacteraceae bacterium]